MHIVHFTLRPRPLACPEASQPAIVSNFDGLSGWPGGVSGMRQLVVTFQASEQDRQAIKQSLEDLAEVRFLADIASEDRMGVLKKAEVLFSWIPTRELGAEEIAVLQKAQFMELLSAGADHLPLDMFPIQMSIAGNPWVATPSPWPNM